jgi:hypothetical protein
MYLWSRFSVLNPARARALGQLHTPLPTRARHLTHVAQKKKTPMQRLNPKYSLFLATLRPTIPTHPLLQPPAHILTHLGPPIAHTQLAPPQPAPPALPPQLVAAVRAVLHQVVVRPLVPLQRQSTLRKATGHLSRKPNTHAFFVTSSHHTPVSACSYPPPVFTSQKRTLKRFQAR